MSFLSIAAFMQPSPVIVAPGAPLAVAHRAMREHRTGHLVVLDQGSLVGLISLDDLHLIESLGDVDPMRVPIEDAMSRELYTVAPRDSVAAVAAGMLERGTDVAVVVDDRQVAGLFTARDALAVLAALMEKPARGREHASPEPL